MANSLSGIINQLERQKTAIDRALAALQGIEGILTDQEIAATIRGGKGRMPPFTSLSDEQFVELHSYFDMAAHQMRNV